MTYLTEETLENAANWFESMGFSVDISHNTLRLILNVCDVELSQSEIEGRAEQWVRELNREN